MLDPGRDEFESALIRLAVQAGRPVLGVCRGHQILNVSLGGTLIADLPDEAGEGHGFLGYPPDHRSHAVVTHPGTTAAHLYGDRLMVNSYHHQAVDTIAPGLRAIAYAPDGVVEAIELPGADVVGVQWHPEMLAHADPIFGWLVGSATARSSVGEERSHAHA
jgi:putative glutamine amidotransferase